MKKILIYIAILLGISGGLFYIDKKINEPAKIKGNKSLIIYNWGDYLDPKLIKKFEHEYNYKVVYETFDSNEAMFSKVKQGGTSYDIAIPSDYMIQKMKSEHLLKKLDKKKITGLSNIGESFLNKSFDKNNQYSVPYFWGTLGIVYDKRLPAQDIPDDWRDLWNPDFKKKILLVDSARDIMGMSLIDLGFSVNTKNDQELEDAKKNLDELAPNVKAIVADEIKMYMADNEAPIAVTWSGEASEIMNQNNYMNYIVPDKGSNMWFDNIVIPKTSKNTKGAYDFINFMLKPKNAAQNANYIGYATPNNQAKKYINKKQIDNPELYPSEDKLQHLQVYKELNQEYIEKYNDLFLEFKMISK
ncbi:spermidine/putrescine ABC transporter substrate-binding protein [Companilactobacillus sp. RD055328]|uniref:ABC transporter substrate-binding protein n=1 Tax=Companilactobacillus sp. RD055328 TaxID=2916634 RepID=UPI001FC7FE4D|nr:ABC transporter substrate-binding protein [Companilactobacillus sp. RD055328]GKQ43001.1 spermidine/putrescine ABC transporter substrate-binding protein [Companilactobacillus sp. RD055328]